MKDLDLLDLLALIPPPRPLPAGAHAGVDAAEERTDEWTRRVLRQAIEHLAATRVTFTSDDLEEVVRDCRPNQIGAAFRSARQAGLIAPTGQATNSTRQTAHARVIRVWASCEQQDQPIPTQSRRTPC